MFKEGAPRFVSRKEELSTDLLDRFLHRPVIMCTKRPVEVKISESTENIETTLQIKDETHPEEPASFKGF